MLLPADVTLGILAGGRGSRLGGRDKAWLIRNGQPQVRQVAAQLAHACGSILVSANAQFDRYRAHGLETVADTTRDVGPMGGLEALADACRTRWLLTVPIDLVEVPDRVLGRLAEAGEPGAVVEDDDGPQPLLALYEVDPLRRACAVALESGAFSVQAMQGRLGLPAVHFAGVRIGNLNTAEDVNLAGIQL